MILHIFRIEKANDVPASAYNFLFKKNSSSFKFKYVVTILSLKCCVSFYFKTNSTLTIYYFVVLFRGRTQAEVENDFDRRPRNPPEFHR